MENTVMKKIKIRQLVISFLVIFLCLILIEGNLNLTSAQENPETKIVNTTGTVHTPTKIEKEFTILLSQINREYDTLEEYKKTYTSSGVSAEDKSVLKLQIYKLRIQIIDDVQQLAEMYTDMEKSVLQPLYRPDMEGIFSRITTQIWSHIKNNSNEIDALRAKRAKTEINNRSALENEISKLNGYLDQYFEKSYSNIKIMEQIGMDITPVKDTFIKLLNERINELSGRLSLDLVRFDEFETLRKENPDETDVIKNLSAVKKSLDTNKKSMNAILELMKALKLDTSTYHTQLLTGTREISSGSFDTVIVFRLMRLSYKNSMDWLAKNGPGYLVKFLLFIIIIFIAVFIARIVRMGLDKALNAPNLKLSKLAHRMIVSTSSKLIILFGILIALSQWGISLGPLLAGLGIAGFIVGFALQGILGNFASGIMILLYRPFDVDDLIDVGGIFGKVEKMSLVSTSLLTVDNQLFIVPNSKIWGDVIKNETAQKFRRIDMVFGISYSDSVQKAELILKEILESHNLVLDSPKPIIHLHTLNESSVDFVVRPWVKVENYWEVYWDVTRSVKLRFDEEGITIPFPQRDVHIHNHDSMAQQN
jgi:small conductance mechanosensitive channel